jgi:hypothetical protein
MRAWWSADFCGICWVFEGGFGESGFTTLCFCGEVVVDCVVNMVG